MISIEEAVEQGITKLRRDNWANPKDHIEIYITEGCLGPWVKLWSPTNEIIGETNPQKLLITMFNTTEKIWETYKE